MVRSRVAGAGRTRVAAALVVAALVAVACTDDATAAPATEPGPETDAQVQALCESTRDLHSLMIDAANDMSGREVGAEPEERAVILADGLDAIVDIAAEAQLPAQPPELVIGLAGRRDQVVADLRVEARAFRDQWQAVHQDQRRSAVNAVFILAEKAMSETEPRVTSETPAFLVEAARATEACQFVVQLPPES